MKFWFGKYGDSVRLWMLEPAVSFGQAILWRDSLNTREWTKASANQLQWIWQTIGKAAAELQLPFAALPIENIKLVECDYGQWAAYTASMPEAWPALNEADVALLEVAMQGRSLLWEEVLQLMEHHGMEEAAAEPAAFVQAACLRGGLTLDQGVRRKQARRPPFFRPVDAYQCHRCGGDSSTMAMSACDSCGTKCPYCEQCLTMGRARFCSVVVSSPAQPMVRERQVSEAVDGDALAEFIRPWGLSEIQAEASEQALLFLQGNSLRDKPSEGLRRFLIWAVTGAGKTEMIFPLIQYIASAGGHVVVATPRRDVVLELKPRIEKAFAPFPVVTLYGGSDQRWDRGAITIATTHQLMRFDRAFDLVIIDELDAFPYHNNPMLEHAALKVCAPDGATVLLSATPPKHLQKAAKRRHIPHVKVSARYHRHPLPVPTLMTIHPIRRQLDQSALSGKLKDRLSASLQRGAQVFVFVPKIQMVEPLTQLLRRSFPGVPVEGTSSKDDQRSQKVTDFRSKHIRMLVTTTILERGVTIPKSDVFILDADGPIFDAAALVQMAGRAGRSAEDPHGFVYFAAKERTRAQVEAIRQIKGMNALARKKGYLNEKGVRKS